MSFFSSLTLIEGIALAIALQFLLFILFLRNDACLQNVVPGYGEVISTTPIFFDAPGLPPGLYC